MTTIKKGLYLITQESQDFTTSREADLLNKILKEGISFIQYRNKISNDNAAQITALKKLTKNHDTILIINDSPVLCAQHHCDGVHLGRDDGSIYDARTIQEKDIIVGVTCYNDTARAHTAVKDGADYVAFGAMYSSPSKPEAIHCPIQTLSEFTKTQPNTPAIAIGGITVENSRILLEAGAHSLAVISAIWDTPDPLQSVRNFNQIFKDFS